MDLTTFNIVNNFFKMNSKYVSISTALNEWTGWDLNPRPCTCEAHILPLNYQPSYRLSFLTAINFLLLKTIRDTRDRLLHKMEMD